MYQWQTKQVLTSMRWFLLKSFHGSPEHVGLGQPCQGSLETFHCWRSLCSCTFSVVCLGKQSRIRPHIFASCCSRSWCISELMLEISCRDAFLFQQSIEKCKSLSDLTRFIGFLSRISCIHNYTSKSDVSGIQLLFLKQWKLSSEFSYFKLLKRQHKSLWSRNVNVWLWSFSKLLLLIDCGNIRLKWH